MEYNAGPTTQGGDEEPFLDQCLERPRGVDSLELNNSKSTKKLLLQLQQQVTKSSSWLALLWCCVALFCYVFGIVTFVLMVRYQPHAPFFMNLFAYSFMFCSCIIILLVKKLMMSMALASTSTSTLNFDVKNNACDNNKPAVNETGQNTLRSSSHLVSEWVWVVIGFLGAVGTVLQVISDSHVEGVVQNVVTLTTVPAVFIFSLLILGKRYGIGECAGALLVVVGIFISFLPDFFGVNRSSFGSPLWSLTFLMGQLPNALIYVLQERIFGRVNLDTWYMLAKMYQWTIIFIIVLLPVNAIPNFGSADGISGVLSSLKEGFLCFLGQTHANGCQSGAGFVLFLASFAVLLSNAAGTALIKYGSASMQILVQAVALPLSDVVFTWHVVMRKYVESLNAYTVVSLAVSVCGMLAFNYFKLRKSKKEQTGVEEKPSQDFHSQVNDQHPTSESPALGLYPSNKKRQLAINVDDDESAPLLL